MNIENQVTTTFTVDDKSSAKTFDMADAFAQAVQNAKLLGTALDNISKITSAYATNARSMQEHLSSISSLSDSARTALTRMTEAAEKGAGATSRIKQMSSAMKEFSTSIDASSFAEVSSRLDNIISKGTDAQQRMKELASSVSGIQKLTTAGLMTGSTPSGDIISQYEAMQAKVASLQAKMTAGTGGTDISSQFLKAKTQLALLAEEYDAYAQKALGADDYVSASFIRQTKNVATLENYVARLNTLFEQQQMILRTSTNQNEITAAYQKQLEIQKETESVMKRVKSMQAGTSVSGPAESGTSILSALTGRNAQGIQNVITNISKLGIVSPGIARATSFLSLFNTELSGTSAVMATVGTMGVAALVAGFAKISVAAVKAAAEFQDYRVTLQALSTMDWQGKSNFSSAVMGVGTAVFSEGVAYAEKTGYSIDKVSSSLERLVGYGIDMRAVNTEMGMLGNLALGSSTRLENLAVAYGQVFGQGKARAQEMYQFINAGIPIFDLLAKKLNVSTATVMDMTRKGEVSFDMIRSLLKDMTSEGGRYADIMERITNTSFSKQQEVFSTELKQLLASIGDHLLPSVTSLLRQVNASLDRFNAGSTRTSWASKLNAAIDSGSSKAVTDALSNMGTTDLTNYNAPAVQTYRLLQQMASSGYLKAQGSQYTPLLQSLQAAKKQPDEISAVESILPVLYKGVVPYLINTGYLSGTNKQYIEYLGQQVSGQRTASSAVNYLETSGMQESDLVKMVVNELVQMGKLDSGALGVLSSGSGPKAVLGAGGISQTFDRAGITNDMILDALTRAFSSSNPSLDKWLSSGTSFQGNPLKGLQSPESTRVTLEEQRNRGTVTVGQSGLMDDTAAGIGSASSKLAEYNQKLREAGATYLAINPDMQEFVKIQGLYNEDMQTVLTLQDKYPEKSDKVIEGIDAMAQKLGVAKEVWQSWTTVSQAKLGITASLKEARTEAVNLYQASQQLLTVQKTFSAFQGNWDPFKVVYNTSPDSVSKSRQTLIDKGVKDLQQSTQMFDPESEAQFRKIVAEQVTFTENMQKAKISATEAASSFSSIYSYLRGADFGKMNIGQAKDNVQLIADAMGESRDDAEKLLDYMVKLGAVKVPLDDFAKALKEFQDSTKSSVTGLTPSAQNTMLSQLAVYNMPMSAFARQQQLSRVIKTATGTDIWASDLESPRYAGVRSAASSLVEAPLNRYQNALTRMNSAAPDSAEYASASEDVKKYADELTRAASAAGKMTSGLTQIKSSFEQLGTDSFKSTFSTLAKSIYEGTDAMSDLTSAFESLAATFLDNVSSVLISVAAGFAQSNQPWLALATLAAAGLSSFVGGILSSASSTEDESTSNDSYLQALQNLQDQLDTFMEQFRATLAYVSQARQEYIAASQLASAGAYAKGDSFGGGVSLSQGVYTKPTVFAYAQGDAFGVMAEVPGSAEAVMPLKRGSDGSLGVKNYGGSAQVAVSMPVNIINNTSSEVSAQQVTDSSGNTSLQVLVDSAVQQSVAGGSLDSVLAARFGVIYRGVRR